MTTPANLRWMLSVQSIAAFSLCVAIALIAWPARHSCTALLIGDSISLDYAPYTNSACRVSHVGENARDTRYGLSRMSNWLGSRRWDVVHVNFGLWDLAYRSGSAQAVSLDEYKANVRAILATLKGASTRVVWATTTIVPRGAKGLRPEDVEAYNAAASDIAGELGVEINDLFSVSRTLPRLSAVDVHFTDEGSRILGRHVAAAIKSRYSEVP
jgi:acyl-CoA thioesterase-1